MTVNGKPAAEYFGGRLMLHQNIQLPLRLTNSLERFDAIIKVVGGGVSGQAGAVRHGIARALVRSDEELRPVLKAAHLLTRDARVKERKKVSNEPARRLSTPSASSRPLDAARLRRWRLRCVAHAPSCARAAASSPPCIRTA